MNIQTVIFQMRSVGDTLCVERRCDQFAIYRRFLDIAQMCERHASIIWMSIKWTIDRSREKERGERERERKIRLIHFLAICSIEQRFIWRRYSRGARHKYFINDIVWVNISLSIFQCSSTKTICERNINCNYT